MAMGVMSTLVADGSPESMISGAISLALGYLVAIVISLEGLPVVAVEGFPVELVLVGS